MSPSAASTGALSDAVERMGVERMAVKARMRDSCIRMKASLHGLM